MLVLFNGIYVFVLVCGLNYYIILYGFIHLYIITDLFGKANKNICKNFLLLLILSEKDANVLFSIISIMLWNRLWLSLTG